MSYVAEVRSRAKQWVENKGYRVYRDRYKPLLGESIFGWMTKPECQKLHQLATYSHGSILEIGHFLGKSTACICEGICDSGRSRRFDSYDLDFTSADQLADYYFEVFGTAIEVPEEYDQFVYSQNKTTTEIARENLERLGLSRLRQTDWR